MAVFLQNQQLNQGWPQDHTANQALATLPSQRDNEPRDETALSIQPDRVTKQDKATMSKEEALDWVAKNIPLETDQRLQEGANGEFHVRPKHPAYIVGEQIVAPAFNAVYTTGQKIVGGMQWLLSQVSFPSAAAQELRLEKQMQLCMKQDESNDYAACRLADAFQVDIDSLTFWEECFDKAYSACIEGNYDLLEKAGRNNVRWLKNDSKRSVLLQLIVDGEYDTVKELVSRKIMIFNTDSSGNTALHYAARKGLDKLLALLWQDLDLDQTNALGQTPLHHAIAEGRVKCTKALIDEGADIHRCFKWDPENWKRPGWGTKNWKNTPILHDMNPLALAVMYGRNDCFSLLIDKGADRHVNVNAYGNLLHVAVVFGQIETLSDQLPRFDYSELNQRNRKGFTPIMEAALRDDSVAIVELAGYGADVETRDYNGQTAMHWAAINRNAEAIKGLYYMEANPKARNNDGQTPYDLIKGEDDYSAFTRKLFDLLSKAYETGLKLTGDQLAEFIFKSHSQSFQCSS